MKYKTQQRIVKLVYMAILILGVLWCLDASAATKEEVYDKYYLQPAKLIDCQLIRTDETSVKGGHGAQHGCMFLLC